MGSAQQLLLFLRLPFVPDPGAGARGVMGIVREAFKVDTQEAPARGDKSWPALSPSALPSCVWPECIPHIMAESLLVLLMGPESFPV